jgi:hypothetical protein
MQGNQFLNVEHVLPAQSWVDMKNHMSDRAKEPPPPSDHYPPIKLYRLSSGGTMHTDGFIH